MTRPSTAAMIARPVEVFYAYSHKDEALRDELETHLSILKRRGVISGWHDRRILGGMEWAEEIDAHLNKADLILLLVSADFIASDYCYDKEMTRAMARHQLGEARVIPVILRHCDWDFAPFSQLQALPKDGKPVAAWASRDEALKDVAVGIKKAAEELGRVPARPWREREIVSPRLPRPSAQPGEYHSPVRSPLDLRLYGPRLKVKIGPPILGTPASAGRFVTTDALIDTGAQRTILVPEAVQKVGLSKIDETTLIRVGGEVKADVYAASLQFPHSGLSAIEMIAVPCCELPHPLFRCLLGRDVLSRWIFTYDGPTGTWLISEGSVSSWVEPP